MEIRYALLSVGCMEVRTQGLFTVVPEWWRPLPVWGNCTKTYAYISAGLDWNLKDHFFYGLPAERHWSSGDFS